jgi:hypothetical protein
MDRVLASEARGCGFDPRRARQFYLEAVLARVGASINVGIIDVTAAGRGRIILLPIVCAHWEPGVSVEGILLHVTMA